MEDLRKLIVMRALYLEARKNNFEIIHSVYENGYVRNIYKIPAR